MHFYVTNLFWRISISDYFCLSAGNIHVHAFNLFWSITQIVFAVVGSGSRSIKCYCKKKKPLLWSAYVIKFLGILYQVFSDLANLLTQELIDEMSAMKKNNVLLKKRIKYYNWSLSPHFSLQNSFLGTNEEEKKTFWNFNASIEFGIFKLNRQIKIL